MLYLNYLNEKYTSVFVVKRLRKIDFMGRQFTDHLPPLIIHPIPSLVPAPFLSLSTQQDNFYF